MPIYPSLKFDAAAPLQLLPWPILAGVVFYAWMRRRTWGRHVLLALGFFLAMMAPVLGFVAKHHITMTWSLDHLDYLPMIGLAALAALGFSALEARIPSSLGGAVVIFLAVTLAALAWQSRENARIYQNQEALLQYTMKMNPLAWPANYNLGRSLLQAGKLQPAIEQLQQAIALAPSYAKAHFLLGNAYVQQGRTGEALEQYQQAIDAQPGYADAHYNLGDLLKQTGRLDEAAAQYQEALRLDPTLFKADYNLGNLLLRAGLTSQAIDRYRAALELKPDYAGAHDNLANALMKSGQAGEAITEYQLSSSAAAPTKPSRNSSRRSR
jgi:tetratricopeptide (TPR) repeat protein